MKKQNINKTNKIKKNLLLTSIGAFAIAFSTITISVANSSSASSLNKNVISFNNGIATLSLTNNSSKKDALVNPNELIWMSEDLNSTNTPVVDGDGQPNIENIAKWNNFFEQVSSLEGDSSIKDEILAMQDTLDNVVNSNAALQNLYQTYEQLRDQYPNLNLPTDDQIREEFLQDNPGVVLDMSQIPGINDIKSKLLELSGIVEGSSIATISNQSNIQTDLTGTGNTPINIENYAGETYTQLIKIAEISASAAGNYALEFEFKKSATSLTAKGVLYIKNDNNQIQNATSAAQLYSQLDIFGRKTAQSNNATLDETFKNFVIQKNNLGNLEIMVRIQDNQTFTNMKFRTDIAGASNLQSPAKFGILDVQATNTYSFVSKINGNENQGLLISGIDDTNIVKNVQFFSETLSSYVLNAGENEFTHINQYANRKLTFYQVGEFDYSLPLWIANNSRSDAASNIYTYEALTNYENGASTGVQKELTIRYGTSGAQLSEDTYSLYEGLKDALPEDAIDGFPESSTIILESFQYSIVNANNGTYLKNEITFFDHFYAIGQRVDGYSWNSVNRAIETNFIAIVDPTQKIFLEKPQVFAQDDISSTVVTTTLTAEESVNERTTVIKFLGHIYNEFSKTNGGEFAGQSYSIGSQTLWNASTTGTNISPKTININNVNAHDIYNLLNNYWKGGQAFSNNWYGINNIFNNLFSVSQNENKYDGTILATAQNVVENVLAKTNEFTSNPAEVEKIIQEAINIVKGESGSIDSSITYDSLDQTKKNELAKKLVELIKFQFGTISNEFDSRQYEAVYSKLKDVINNNSNTISIKINDPSNFLETLNVDGINIFRYIEGTTDQISVSGTTVTLKESLKTVFDLLYFQNSETDQINLGSSIFNSDSSSLAFETLDSSLLTSFESANETITTRKNVVLVYSQMLSLFVSQSYNFSEAINKMLESGKPLSLAFDLKSALNQLITKISSANKSSSLAPANTNVQSYCLDDIISGTNAIICLNWKLNQLLNGTETQANKLRVSTTDLINQINSILENIQVSPDELATWSNILTSDGYNFSPYTEDFSGRNGQEALEKIVAAITNDENIMKSRSEDRIAGVAEVKKWLELLWWIIIALIGVGILVSSSVGLATKERQIRLSSRPILKWLLISTIILGIIVTTVAILVGVGIL